MPDVQPGQVLLDRYTLIRRLGEGPAGETWLANDDGRSVVIKRTGPAALDAAPRLRRVLGPSLLRVRAVEPCDGGALVVADHQEAGDLERWVVEGRGEAFPPREAAELTLQLVEGLEALHGVGLLHGGLHPGNVLVEEREGGLPTLRLTHFGLPRPDAPPASVQADVRAAAVCGWWLATGSTPDQGDRLALRLAGKEAAKLEAALRGALTPEPEDLAALKAGLLALVDPTPAPAPEVDGELRQVITRFGLALLALGLASAVATFLL